MKRENWRDLCDSIIRNKGRGPKNCVEKKGPDFFPRDLAFISLTLKRYHRRRHPKETRRSV